MNYSDFTIDDLKEKFQLEFIEDQPLSFRGKYN
jgi:hypothetical protein